MNSIGTAGASSTHAISARSASRSASAREALAERAVADLVVRLQAVDERQRRQRVARLAARRAVAVRRRLALESEAFGERAPEQPQRPVGVVGVVAVAFAGDEHMRRVVQVVVPLRRRSSGAARLRARRRASL